MPRDSGVAHGDRTSDQPLTNPEKDLLGMASHAAVLARLVRTVPTPFTIGIYGEWGTGKTTFVRFVEHSLEHGEEPQAPRTLFVHFEGWRHRTADELWRGLMLELARAVFERVGGTEAVTPPRTHEDGAPRPTLRQRLAGDAVVLRAGDPEKTARNDYLAFVRRLDSTMFGGISKRSPDALRLDGDEAILAAVRASVAALGAASPLVGGLRQLLGGAAVTDAAALFHRERNEATRERIESRQEFQDALTALLGRLPDDERVCVFLDDLDRCMPDVVLDLLEAIKIFLHVPRLVFVVAADEALIGKGLRLRYRELLEGPDAAPEGKFFARKGHEYFEKIIQLRINLPECTPEHAHRFIAAQFPEWMPATDIILSAVGSNPRRLKQYCSWLMFRHGVDQAERNRPTTGSALPDTAAGSGQAPPPRAALFDKLVALASRDAKSLELLRVLAREPDFAGLVTGLEDRLREVGEDASESVIAACIPDRRLWPFCQRVSASTPLFELFRAPPPLSAYPPIEVETLAAMADLRPHPELMLTAGDGPFMRVLRHLAHPGISTPDRIFFEDLTKLVALRARYPAVFQALPPLAQDDDGWAAGTRALESALQTGQEAELPGGWAALFGTIRELDATGPSDGGPTVLLLQTPRLSEMLPQEVAALGEIHATLPDAAQLLSGTVYTGSVVASEAEKARLLAQHALEHVRPALHDDIHTRLGLRKWAAEHCVALRSFAKLNALERQWPELARMLRTDRATLKALEGEALRPGSIAPEHQAVWDRFADDERLCRFLVLTPLVTDIAPADVRQYFTVSQSIAPAGEPGVSRPAAPDSARVRFDYVDLVVTLAPLGPDVAEAPGTEAGPPLPGRVRVTLEEAEQRPIEVTVQTPWTELKEFLPRLSLPATQALISRQVGPVERQLPRQGGSPEAAQRELGGLLWRWVFTGAVGDRLRELHARGDACRLLMGMPAGLALLPWETLYLERERIFLALTQRYSLVRYMKPPSFVSPVEISAPLRILVVLSNPVDTAPLNLEGELAAIEEAVEPAMRDGRVSLHVLRNRKATIDELTRVVRTFRPHVFHFTGHGVFRGDEGGLVFHHGDGRGRTIMAGDMATLLRDARISLAFLNACDTGTAAENDAVTGVAGSLVNAGVPAVVATLRVITDDAGLLFTRELYRAFAEGYPLEAAMAEARKRLSVERWDWSAYALFSSTRELDALVFPQGGPVRKT